MCIDNPEFLPVIVAIVDTDADADDTVILIIDSFQLEPGFGLERLQLRYKKKKAIPLVI